MAELSPRLNLEVLNRKEPLTQKVLKDNFNKIEKGIIITDTDPGEGSESTYPDGTVILVYE